ncbi:2-nitropropane dioxygenase [Wenyingzhuangia fucanilytica]|uniref:2-nitropropane dioxygenase n=1 Tax=Wenyingzhuangia fucanilytica TaxID=1790137 RepID=A0A1B1Y431_9FLAO|nr:nitronate monooxygenase [Wenyingzhuangia fucanilytica]ANW95508.1 2-nitropropane dioxygenase [Wenyingzhuangia fucanilytica]
MQNNRITKLFNIDYSIIQGGMVWVSGYKLASAVSNAGGLGLIGAGSMYPEVFREHIQKCKKATDKPFGVNLPLIYPDIDKMVDIVIEEGVKIVFTSAGNPNTWTSKLKSHGIKVVHVVSSIKFALKAQEAGVDAVVAEGFEAGGHNGREETTTFTLIPMVKEHLTIPLIAAGGIASGRGILAAEVLGADGVQIGSRFAVSTESSAHIKFKNLITELQDGTTQLTFKELAPVRIIKNNYYQKLLDLYQTHPSKETLKTFYDNAKLKTGIFEGDVIDGKLEIGQIAGLIKQVKPIATIMEEMITEYKTVKQNLN